MPVETKIDSIKDNLSDDVPLPDHLKPLYKLISKAVELAAILDENNVERGALSPATFYDCEVIYERGEHQRALERMIAFMEETAEKHGIEV